MPSIEIENAFKAKCKENLPKYIMVDEYNYQLCCHMLLVGGYRIFYSRIDDGKDIIDLFYNIVEIIPKPVEYKEHELRDASIYKTSVDEIIEDVLFKLKEFNYSYKF